MGRIFLWLSGADRDILEKCTSLSRSERIRFGGLGALVLIPSLLGTISMTYAVSTVVPDGRIAVGAGAIWGLIVLVIDRYLISTIHKSSLNRREGRLISILCRYVFAVFVGIAVSHPFILLWFNDSIEQTIDQNRRAAVAARNEVANDERSAITASAVEQQSTDLINRRNERADYKDCLTTLQTYEQSNRESIVLPCGVSSGIASCGPRCAEIGYRIDQVQAEIVDLDRQIAAQREIEQAQADADRQSRDERLQSIEDRATKDIQDIEANFSSDYLARVDALDQISRDRPHVQTVALFMIMFFIFVDVLPVTMKIVTPPGEYEEIRDTALVERRSNETTQREVANSETLAGLRADVGITMQEVETRTDLVQDVVRLYTKRLVDFEDQLAGLSKANWQQWCSKENVRHPCCGHERGKRAGLGPGVC